MEFFKKHTVLLSIIIIAFVIRLVGLSDNPPALNWDEISHGWNAYSLLKTGKDEWGMSFPTIFRAFGDYKLPVYIYLTSLSVLIFGLTEFATRLPSAIAGVGTVFFTYHLLQELLGNKKQALFAAFLVAIEPWSLFLSRGAFEANLALFLITSGSFWFLKGLKKSLYLLLSTIFFGLSVWTYNSARLFVPLLIVASAFIFRQEMKTKFTKNKIVFYISFLLLCVFLIPMFMQLFNRSGQARYEWVAIIDQGAVGKIESQRQSSTLPSVVIRALYNRPVYFVTQVTKNWVAHFFPEFLFLKGGSHYQFSIPGIGLLNPLHAALFYMGIFVCIRQRRKRKYQWLLAWLIFAPIASSITRESPHVLRSITLLPLPMVLVSIGGLEFYSRLTTKYFLKHITSGLYIVVSFLFLTFYLFTYATSYRTNYSWVWQYGYKEVVSIVKERYAQYDAFVVTKQYGEPHVFLLFYLGWDPAKYQQDPKLIRFEQSDWLWVDRFDKFFFVNEWDIIKGSKLYSLESGYQVDCLEKRCMLIATPKNTITGWKETDRIYFLNGETAFIMYEN